MPGVEVVRSGEGPVGATAIPAPGGGARIYCAFETTTNNDSSSALIYVEASLEVELTARSTINIQIVWDAPGEDFSKGWSLSPKLDPSKSFNMETTSRYAQAYTSALTRDPGTYTFTASAYATVLSMNVAQVFLVVIIGDNTEADCVEQAPAVG